MYREFPVVAEQGLRSVECAAKAFGSAAAAESLEFGDLCGGGVEVFQYGLGAVEVIFGMKEIGGLFHFSSC